MRSIKGYCMSQARREAYRAFRNVNWNKPATKSEVSDHDVLIVIGGLFGLLFFINLLMS